ncbi:hypothetical protein [Actinomadura chokoriensis]|uniref:hypothetical protein n=1 Tax=Actinomadura chokoriensis TaxID=454156 RepID=UPI0031F7F7BB
MGGREGVRRGPQLLAWALVLTVFCGLALLSGQAGDFGSRPQASVPPAVAAGPPESAVADGGGLVLAVGAPHDPTVPSGLPTIDSCSRYDEKRDFLPLYRWNDLSLFGVDNSFIFKTQLFVTMVSSLMFMAAAMAWRIIGVLMGVGYGFDMICSAAGPINFVGRSMSRYASWFLIPGWVFVLMTVARRLTSGRHGGPASALRLLVVFLVATGMIFFIGDQSNKNMNNPTGPYTLPWMATTVQGWVGTTTDSLQSLQELGRFNRDKYAHPLFYDGDPAGGTGKITCAALGDALYEKYRAQNKNTSMKDGSATMIQLSKMWEVTLVRSWQAAQFGEGTLENPSAAHASCRVLEAHSDVDLKKKLEAYDLAGGNTSKTTDDMLRAYYLDPKSDEQTIMIAWGACKGNDSGSGTVEGGTIPQWNDSAVEDREKACDTLYSSSIGNGDDNTGFIDMLFGSESKVRNFYFNGNDELQEKLGGCVTTKEACRASWDFVSSWLGQNQAQRLTQSLMSLIVSFVFLFVLGPVALGQAISSVALAGLVMILPVTLLLLGLSLHQGKRLLKLTGAAAMGNAYFTFAITLLTMFIDTTTGAVNSMVGTNSPTFFEQVAQGMAPLVALYLYRRLSRILGTGDLSTTTGALGFAGAMVLRTSGDRQLSRNADQRMSRSLGRLGAGRMRLGALDERSLQRRMLNNKATRAMASSAGQGVKRAARPLTDWTKDRYDASRARFLRGAADLQRRAASGSPAQRAKAYADLSLGLAAVNVAGSPLASPSLPLIGDTGGAAALGGGTAAGDRFGGRVEGNKDGPGSRLQPGMAAGFPMAGSARSARRQAETWHRNITRVGHWEKRRELIAGHTKDGLDMVRGRQWGAGQDSRLNMAFDGFSNGYDKAQALAEMAKKTGLRPEQLMLGDHGLALPVPVAASGNSGRRVFASGTSIEQASHPVHYLDRHILRRKMGESDDEYIAKLVANLNDCGYITENGEFVDVYAAHGFDTLDPKVRERVAAYISGGRDEELSKIVITPQRSADSAERAARDWVRDSRPSLAQSRQREKEILVSLVNDTKREISHFNKIPIAMPDGTSTSAGELRAEIEKSLRDMVEITKMTEDLFDKRSKTSIARETFLEERDRLYNDYQKKFQDFDLHSSLLRGAVDASTSARGSYKLAIKLADPSSATDVADIYRDAEELQADLKRGQQQWHETMERLVGSITRKPGNAADAQNLVQSLEEFRVEIAQRISSEQSKNQDVIKDLKDKQRRLEDAVRRARTDPRQPPHDPVDALGLLANLGRR